MQGRRSEAQLMRGTFAGTQKGSLAPIVHSARRKAGQTIQKVRLSRLDLAQAREEIIRKLRSRVKRIPLPMVKSCFVLEAEAKEREEQSFLQRYSPQTHTFTHKLIGTLQLRAVKPRPTQLTRLSTSVPAPLLLCMPQSRLWKALSSIQHFLQLQIPFALVPKLQLLVPSRPYSSAHSFDFMQACKAGDLAEVSLFLQKSRWLALEFDSSHQTALHWAAKRSHLDITRLLLSTGAYIDARDSEGQTALHLASRKGHVDTVRVLLASKANPWLKTEAGRTPLQVAIAPLVRKLLTRSALLFVCLKYSKLEERQLVWEREGLNYFQTAQ